MFLNMFFLIYFWFTKVYMGQMSFKWRTYLENALFVIQQSYPNIFWPFTCIWGFCQPGFKENKHLFCTCFQKVKCFLSRLQSCWIYLIAQHPNFVFHAVKTRHWSHISISFCNCKVKLLLFCMLTQCRPITHMPSPVEMLSNSPSVCIPAVIFVKYCKYVLPTSSSFSCFYFTVEFSAIYSAAHKSHASFFCTQTWKQRRTWTGNCT